MRPELSSPRDVTIFWVGLIVVYLVAVGTAGYGVYRRAVVSPSYTLRKDLSANHRIVESDLNDLPVLPGSLGAHLPDLKSVLGRYTKGDMKAYSVVSEEATQSTPQLVINKDSSLYWYSLQHESAGTFAALDTGVVVDVCVSNGACAPESTVEAIVCQDTSPTFCEAVLSIPNESQAPFMKVAAQGSTRLLVDQYPKTRNKS